MSVVPQQNTSTDQTATNEELERIIEHAAHLLPSQGPITVFVHHNTLHAFEDLSFDEAVQRAGERFHCNPYLTEEQYRKYLLSGRIRVIDLEESLREDLEDQAEILIGTFGTRYSLRLAMLQFPLIMAEDAELHWYMAETDALLRFRSEVSLPVKSQMIRGTHTWVMRDLRNGGKGPDEVKAILETLFNEYGKGKIESWNEEIWEAFTLRFLWQVCRKGVCMAEYSLSQRAPLVRHRDILLASTGEDTDLFVHETLIRFTAAFLDQGFADWRLPHAHKGLFRAFVCTYAQPCSTPARWLWGLRQELDQVQQRGLTALESIEESLELLGVSADEYEQYITDTLLALRGWAGIVWQLETNAPWTPYPAPSGSLVEFLAIRLILDRYAAIHVAKRALNFHGSLAQARDIAQGMSDIVPKLTLQQRTFSIFQLAQVRGWSPKDLWGLSSEQWSKLVSEVETFHDVERRRIFHLAYERKYRIEMLDAVLAHAKRTTVHYKPPEIKCRSVPAYQVVCCLDEREESFRRALEEVDPECETFGIAGFFGVAMYYRSITDAHFKPLCPVNITPQHYVQEEPVYSLQALSRRQAQGRRRLGQFTHRAHRGSRGLLGGTVTSILGSLAAFPLVARVLLPRGIARLRQALGRFVLPPVTELHLEFNPSDSSEHPLGYTVEEMATIVEGGLRSMGLTENMARMIVICGHGSASLNNPHEAAHDCGACGGGRGGPNARAFAQMANDQRVRKLLVQRELIIPEEVIFVGGYHNTCDDSMTWYDLDRIPYSHRDLFERCRNSFDEARMLNAHERCRRFESAELSLSPQEALWHVEGRAEDLSQTRPEYGHATNALCFVGRRQWSRGLFLDRRAFLTSYDPSQDDEESSILATLLSAVIPVCAGINLEYYFSFIDPTEYGCGTKLPHNITSLLGVMDGALSDLRPGLPWQMVEVHEPVRLLFLIETAPENMLKIMETNESIKRLVRGKWVQIAVFDTETNSIHRFIEGRFIPHEPETTTLPTATSSLDWYRCSRDHLGFASIEEEIAQ